MEFLIAVLVITVCSGNIYRETKVTKDIRDRSTITINQKCPKGHSIISRKVSIEGEHKNEVSIQVLSEE